MLVFILAPAAQAFAQGITGQLKIGLTASTFSGETTATISPKVGWGGGVAVGYDFDNGLIAQAEAIYIVKGAYADTVFIDMSAAIPVHDTYDLTYLEVPLLIAYRFETNSRFMPKLFAGPYAAFRLDAHLTKRAQGSELELSELDVRARGMDYGVTFGAGTEVDFGAQRMEFAARVALGLSKARDQADVRNTAFFLSVGLIL